MDMLIPQCFDTEFGRHCMNALFMVAVVAVIGFILRHFLNTIVRKLVSKTNTQLDDRLFDIFVPRVKWLTIIVALYLAAEEISKGILAADRTSQSIIHYSEGIIYIAFVIFITNLLIRLFDTVVQHTMERHARNISSTVNAAILPVLNKVIMIILVLIALVTILGHFGVDVSSLLVFLGGGSVALALAAQETLANMIAGFIIMFDQPFHIGNRIKLPTGETGDVVLIGLRCTNILDIDNNIIVIPNSELTKTRVVNLSYPTTEVRISVDFPVAYGTDMNRAKAIILSAAGENSDVLKTPTPEAILLELKEYSCLLRLVARTANWRMKAPVENALRERIYMLFRTENISSGYSEHVVHMKPDKNDVHSQNS
jgi:small-conductance mechanosensitive channel